MVAVNAQHLRIIVRHVLTDILTRMDIVVYYAQQDVSLAQQILFVKHALLIIFY